MGGRADTMDLGIETIKLAIQHKFPKREEDHAEVPLSPTPTHFPHLDKKKKLYQKPTSPSVLSHLKHHV